MNMQSRGNDSGGWIFPLQPCFFSSEDRGKIWATYPFPYKWWGLSSIKDCRFPTERENNNLWLSYKGIAVTS
jgi:hypothetical protein